MAFNAQGTEIYWSTSTAASTSTSNMVGEIVGFTGPGGAAAEIDVTNVNSVAKEYLIGLMDYGEVSFDMNLSLTDTAQVALRADCVAAVKSKRKCVIKFSDSTTDASRTKATFDAYGKTFSINGAVDSAVKGTLAIRVTGAVTFSSVIT
jgi:hypothetical protein